MSFDRNETRTVLETVVIGGVTVSHVETGYNYQSYKDGVQRATYQSIEVGSESTDLDGLNEVRIVLESLAQMDEIEFAGFNLESLVELVEETASEIAEELEIHFIYDRDGRKREYTPRSLWEPSGSCEWEESATEYDYGWDL